MFMERGGLGGALAEEPLARRGDMLAGVVDVQGLTAPREGPAGGLSDPGRPVAQHVQAGHRRQPEPLQPGPPRPAEPPGRRDVGPHHPRRGVGQFPRLPPLGGSPARPSAASGRRRSSGRAGPSRGCWPCRRRRRTPSPLRPCGSPRRRPPPALASARRGSPAARSRPGGSRSPGRPRAIRGDARRSGRRTGRRPGDRPYAGAAG